VAANNLVPSEVHEGTNPLNNVLDIIVVDRNGVVHEHLIRATNQVMQTYVHASAKGIVTWGNYYLVYFYLLDYCFGNY
jgi:hypothetical protein